MNRSGPETGRVFQLCISLAEIEPQIWRRVLVKKSITLHELHRTIQMLFNWYDYHLYRFEMGNRAFELPGEEAEGEDATATRLDHLGLSSGDVLQYVYDFGDEWIHLIEVEHTAHSGDPDWLPWVMEGARRGPPEDCGGPYGYAEIQTLIGRRVEELEEEDRSLLEWLGPGFDPEDFSLPQARHDLLLASAWGVLKRKR